MRLDKQSFRLTNHVREPFNSSKQGGQVEYKDYTKFIRWTPRKIILLTLCLILPYIGAAIAVGIATAPYIGILMLAVPAILALLCAGFYWILQKAG